MTVLLFLLQTLILVLYYGDSHQWMGPGKFLSSFQWAPVSRDFAWPAFLRLAGFHAASTAVMAAWLGVALGLGREALRLFRWTGDKAETAVLSLGLGMGGLSMLAFALGVMGLYERGGVLLVLGALSGMGFFLARRRGWAQTDVRRLGRPWSGAMDVPLLLLGGLSALALLFHFLGALLPPVGFDEMNYQLALPKLYVLNQGIVPVFQNHLSFLQKNINMLFVLGLLSGGAGTAKLFSFSLGLMAAASLYVFGREWVGRRGAAAGALIFFLLPVVGNQFRLAGTDLGAGFFELTALFLLLRWTRGGGRGVLILSSVFWGLALGSKYSALPGFAASTLLLATRLCRRPAREAPSALALYFLPALALWSPWLLWTWAQTGNPVTPLFSAFLHSRNFLIEGVYQPLTGYSHGLGLPNYFPFESWGDVLRFPWKFITAHNDFNHFMGPAFALAASLLLGTLISRKSGPPPVFLAAAGLYWAGWLLMEVRMTRYFVAGLGLTSLCAGWIVTAADLPGRGRRFLLWAPLTVALAQQVMGMVFIQNTHKTPWGYLAGRCTFTRYLNEHLQPSSPVSAYAFINEALPPEAKVMVIHEYRTFYLDRNFTASTPWNHDYWQLYVRASRTPEELRARLAAKGVTHLFINYYYLLDKTGGRTLFEWTDEEWRKASVFLPQVAETLYNEEGLWVGRVRDAARR